MKPEEKKSMKILIIGGNPAEVKTLNDLLIGINDAGFQSEVVPTLLQGIERINNQSFDMIVFNLSIPDSSGLHSVGKIFATQPDAAVIVLTNKKNETAALEAVSLGADDYLIIEELNSASVKHALLNADARSKYRRLANEQTNKKKPPVEETAPTSGKPTHANIKFHDAQVEKIKPDEHFSLLQELIDNIPNPIFYKNKDLIYTGCNKAFEDFIGYPAEKIIGSSVLGVSPLELAVVYHDADAKLLKNRGKQVYESKVQSHDGSIRDVVFYKSVYYDSNGNPDGIVGMIIDITDKKRTLEKLQKESEISEGIASLTQLLLQPGLTLDSVSRLILTEAQKFTGAKNGFTGTIDPETGDLVIQSFADSVDDILISQEPTLTFGKKDYGYPTLLGYALNTRQAFYTNDPRQHPAFTVLPNNHLPIDNFLSVPAISEGKLVGLISLANTNNGFTDEDLQHVSRLSLVYAVAMQKHNFYYDLMMAKEKAEQSDKLKSTFLANMSHEIRTPLNAIVGFSEMLAETELTQDENRQFRNIISQNSDLLLKLINDIIEMAMIEAGELKIKTQLTKVEDIARDAFNYFALNEAFLKQRAELEFKYMPDQALDSYFIDTDPIRLTQILKNLIHNAFRFTKKGHIHFGFRLVDDSSVELSVEDTGIGISAEQQKYIFDKFRQVDEMSVRPYSGTGLGLTITKKLVEKLNGTISIESELHKGTIFRIIFPVTPQPLTNQNVQSQKKNTMSGKIPNLSNLTFLVVEDNPSSFEFLKILLKDFKIIQACDGREAVQKFVENPEINIVLMDLQLPNMNGYEAIKIIKKYDKTVPVIVQTAFSTNIERTKALDAGAEEFLIKPIVKRELMEAINRVVGKNL